MIVGGTTFLPWASNEERLVSEALAAQEYVARTRPKRKELQRPRFGYEKRAMTINDVFALSRNYPDFEANYSGGPAGWQASSRNAMTAGFGW